MISISGVIPVSDEKTHISKPQQVCYDCRYRFMACPPLIDTALSTSIVLETLPPVTALPMPFYNAPVKVSVSTQTPTFYSTTSNRQCATCGQVFMSFKGMKLHVARVHSNINRQVPCPLCDKRFKHKYAVKFHVKQVHEQATRVMCPTCNKQFYNKYKLDKHLKNRHLKVI